MAAPKARGNERLGIKSLQEMNHEKSRQAQALDAAASLLQPTEYRTAACALC